MPPTLAPTPMPAFAAVESDPSLAVDGLATAEDVAAIEPVVVADWRLYDVEESKEAEGSEANTLSKDSIATVEIELSVGISDAIEADVGNGSEEIAGTDSDCANAAAAAMSQLVTFTVSRVGEQMP
jgi:hypothetical protein